MSRPSDDMEKSPWFYALRAWKQLTSVFLFLAVAALQLADSAHAQAGFGHPEIIHFEVLRGVSENVSIKEICCDTGYKFETGSVEDVATEYGERALWLRIDQALPDGIIELTPVVDRVTMYVWSQSSQSWQQSHSGDSISTDERALNSPFIALPVKGLGSESPVFMRIVQPTLVTIKLHHMSSEAFFVKQSTDLTIKTLLIGFVLAIVAYNILLAFLILDLAYLLNALCIMSLLMQALYLSGYGVVYFWPHAPFISNQVNYLSMIFAVVFGASFIWIFIRRPGESIRRAWPIYLAPVMAISAFLAAFIVSYWWVQLVALLSAAIFLIMSASFTAYRAYRGNRRAHILLYPMALSVLPGIFLTAVIKLAGFELELLGNNALEVTLCAEAVLFSLALAARIRTAEAERSEMNAKIVALRNANAARAIAAQDAERQRLAKELHDGVGQDFLFVLGDLKKMRQDTPPKDWRRSIGKLVASATSAIEELRRISRDMHPSAISYLGLEKALGTLIENFEHSSGIDVDTEISLDESSLTSDKKLHLYRIVQECLSNVVRHADAKAITVSVYQGHGVTNVIIEDDGIGMIVSPTLERSTFGLGLTSIEERVRSLEGTWEISKGGMGGTRVTITFASEDVEGNTLRRGETS